MRYDIKDTHQISYLHIKFNIQHRTNQGHRSNSTIATHHIMPIIIKRIISKRSKVRTYEYTGYESIPKTITHVQFHRALQKYTMMHLRIAVS